MTPRKLARAASLGGGLAALAAGLAALGRGDHLVAAAFVLGALFVAGAGLVPPPSEPT